MRALCLPLGVADLRAYSDMLIDVCGRTRRFCVEAEPRGAAGGPMLEFCDRVVPMLGANKPFVRRDW